MNAPKDALIRVEVTIETVIESTATYEIDRADFMEWSGGKAPNGALLREYLRAGDDWEVCSTIYERGNQDVSNCSIESVVEVATARAEALCGDESAEQGENASAIDQEIRGPEIADHVVARDDA